MVVPGAARLVLSEGDKKRLLRIGRHRSTPRGIVLRVEIVRAAAEGMANRAIARKLCTSLPTVLGGYIHTHTAEQSASM
jgi:DNA-binding NarL/FixJ family response regulator